MSESPTPASSTGSSAKATAPSVPKTAAEVDGDPGRWDRAGFWAQVILWPIGIMFMLQRLVVFAAQGDKTDDFTTVYRAAVAFLNRADVYNEDLTTVDPHYLYPPSGTLLMAPLGVFSPDNARTIFIIGSLAATLGAGYLLIRMFGYTLSSPAAPLVLFFMFSTESVSNTLVFTNFNAVVLFCEMLFLWLLLQRKDWWAGVPLGITFAVKPILAALLLLPLLTKQWRTVVSAFAIPAILMVIAFPLSKDPVRFFRDTLPYLNEPRDYFNSSIVGAGLYFGLPTWLVFAIRLTLGVMTLVSAYWLFRNYRASNPLLWACSTTGLLTVATFVLGSLGQGYYSMMLFPLLMTIVLSGSLARNWVMWLAVYGCLSYDTWLSAEWPAFGRTLNYSKTTLGWSLIIVVIFVVLLFRYLDSRKGIANAWVGSQTPEPPLGATRPIAGAPLILDGHTPPPTA